MTAERLTLSGEGLFSDRTVIREIYKAFLKQIKRISETEYCCHVYVIGYALYAEKGKAVVKKTSEISRIVGISKRTLQFYDDEGVVKAERSESNYRLYDEKAPEGISELIDITNELMPEGIKAAEINALARVYGINKNEESKHFE